MEGSAKMQAELTHALSDISDPDCPTKKIGCFGWMDMDIEEDTARKKREKEQSVLDLLPKRMRVPKKHVPTFVSVLFTGIASTLHMLLALLQVWSVRFNLWMNYVSVDVVSGSMDVPDKWIDLDEETNPLGARQAGQPLGGHVVAGSGV